MHQAGAFPYFHTVSFVGSEAFGKAILEQDVDPLYFDQIIVTQVVPSPGSEDLSVIVDYRRHLEKYFPDETPNYVSLEGYVNARVLTEVLEKTGRDLDRKNLIHTFESMTNLSVGIGKTLSYSTFDHNGFNSIFYSRLDRDGHFRVFELNKNDKQEP
jgi:hypothetical protein